MSNEYTTLWTLHTPDFSIIEGRIDHSKSEYYQNTQGVKKAYHKLWKLINIPDGQIIWCYTEEADIPKKQSIEKILWESYLPESEVIKYVDDIVWNRILKEDNILIPRKLNYQWRREFKCKYPNINDSKAQKNYEKERVKEFREQQPKGNSWWDELFVKNSEVISSNALIRHPVPRDCITNKENWCCEK